jgi:outer membrane protein
MEKMRFRITLGWLLIVALLTAIGYAQEPPTRRLSLADALDIARRNSPDFLAAQNDRWVAGRRLTSAAARLFTPSVDVSGSAYRAGTGQQSFGGVTFPVNGLTRSSWSLGFSYQLSGSTLSNRGLQAAELRATEEDIAGARTLLETGVRQQYLNLLQAKAQVDLARRSIEWANESQALAQARYAVGQGTLIDVRRAEVERRRAEVTLLRAQQNEENEVLSLFERLGVRAPEPARVELTDSFPVTEPRFDEATLIAQALAENPALRALRAREAAARWAVRSARSQYLPTLGISAGYGKFRQCCADVVVYDTTIVPPAPIDTIFDVSTNGTSPWNIAIQLSLPLYDGFVRNVQTAEARALEDDARQAVRGQELKLRAGVSAAYRTVIAAHRTIALQEANRAASGEALELATQRYRVGSGGYIELLDARVAAERAGADYVTAVYDYHKAIAALENAVGRPLR